MKRRINTRVVSDIETGRILSRRGFDWAGPIAKAMGVRFPSVFTNTFIGPLPANATETVILTTPPFSPPLDTSAIFFLWCSEINAGTGTTVLAHRIRRGTTAAGAFIGVQPWNALANVGNAFMLSGCYFDTPGAVGGQQYSLTVSQTGATVAGVWNDGALLVFAL
jgi:hypothetical protein